MDDDDILEHAASQHGLITRREAVAHGLSARQIDHRLARGRWIRLAAGVYRVAGAPATWEGSLLAACLAAGPAAAASHRAAGRLWRLPGLADAAPEIVGDPGVRPKIPGVKVHECCLLLPEDRTSIEGTPVVGPELALIQLAGVVGPRRIDGLVDDAIRRRLTTLDRLRSRLDLLGRSGRDGSGVLRRALDVRSPRHERTHSALERAFVDLVARSSLPRPILQHRIGDRQGRVVAVVDAAWPEARLAVELDGRAFHAPLDRWQRDLTRQNALVTAGWTPLRFTWGDLDEAPARVVRSIGHVLALAA